MGQGSTGRPLTQLERESYRARNGQWPPAPEDFREKTPERVRQAEQLRANKEAAQHRINPATNSGGPDKETLTELIRTWLLGIGLLIAIPIIAFLLMILGALIIALFFEIVAPDMY